MITKINERCQEKNTWQTLCAMRISAVLAYNLPQQPIKKNTNSIFQISTSYKPKCHKHIQGNTWDIILEKPLNL